MTPAATMRELTRTCASGHPTPRAALVARLGSEACGAFARALCETLLWSTRADNKGHRGGRHHAILCVATLLEAAPAVLAASSEGALVPVVQVYAE